MLRFLNWACASLEASCSSDDLACIAKQVTLHLNTSTCNRRVAVALVGAGTFAKKAHLPSLLLDKACFDLRVVWSKSASSAQALSGLVAERGQTPPAFLWGDQGWSEIISGKRAVELIDVVLPISAQPWFVKSALAAGLSVVSEKPVASNSAQAADVLDAWKLSSQTLGMSNCQWFVCENWRFEPAFRVAQAAIRSGAIGQVVAFSANSVTYMPDDLPYMSSESWRMQGSSWIADVGVHLAAALHAILGSELLGVGLGQRFYPLTPSQHCSKQGPLKVPFQEVGCSP